MCAAGKGTFSSKFPMTRVHFSRKIAMTRVQFHENRHDKGLLFKKRDFTKIPNFSPKHHIYLQKISHGSQFLQEILPNIVYFIIFSPNLGAFGRKCHDKGKILG